MLSAIVTIAAAVAGIAAIIGVLWSLWEPLTHFLNWGQDFAQQLVSFLPEWLAPFALVMLILSLVGLGVKLL